MGEGPWHSDGGSPRRRRAWRRGAGAWTEVGVRAAKRLRVDKQLFDDATVPEVAVREVMGRVVHQVRDIGVIPLCRFFPADLSIRLGPGVPP